MSRKRYMDQLKIETVRHATDRALSVADMAERFVATTHSRYVWVKNCEPTNKSAKGAEEMQDELSGLKSEPRRVTE